MQSRQVLQQPKQQKTKAAAALSCLYDIFGPHRTRDITIITVEETEENNKPCRWVLVDYQFYFLVVLSLQEGLLFRDCWIVENGHRSFILHGFVVCVQDEGTERDAAKFVRFFSICFLTQ